MPRPSSLRRKTIIALATSGLFASLPASAQSNDGKLRIAILSSGTQDNRSPLERALVGALRERGYVEGQNLFIDRRYGSSGLVENADELSRMNFDAILTTCTPSTRLMKTRTTSTPIVMVAVSDPVRQGIVESLARPGHNVTGTSSQAEDLLAKRLELLVALVPNASVVAVVANKGNPVHALGWQHLEAAAPRYKLALVKLEVHAGEDLEVTLPAEIERAMQAKAGALLVLPDDPLMFNLRPRLVALAGRYNLPDFYWAREFVDAGGLMSYGESLSASYRGAAQYIDKIKKGANPAVMPVVQPTRFELVINETTAKARGLTVSPALRAMVDDVVR